LRPPGWTDHYLGTVQRIADWVAVMLKGSLVAEGPLETVFQPPYHPYTKLLLSSVLLCESTGGTMHRQWVLEACLATGLPVWVGFKCHQDAAGATPKVGYHSDEPLAASFEQVVAIGGSVVTIFHSPIAATEASESFPPGQVVTDHPVKAPDGATLPEGLSWYLRVAPQSYLRPRAATEVQRPSPFIASSSGGPLVAAFNPAGSYFWLTPFDLERIVVRGRVGDCIRSRWVVAEVHAQGTSAVETSVAIHGTGRERRVDDAGADLCGAAEAVGQRGIGQEAGPPRRRRRRQARRTDCKDANLHRPFAQVARQRGFLYTLRQHDTVG
jgi:hypothetical protein